MMVPTIHLNGTSAESLIDGLCEAYEALNHAYDALRRTAPNGRDYYLHGPHALGVATNEHMARMAKVDEVKKELDGLIEAIELVRRGQ